MNKQRKVNFLIAGSVILLIAFIFLTAGCSSAAKPQPTPTPDLVGQVKAFEDAFNRHDVDGATAMFADNAWYLGSYPTQQIHDNFVYSAAMNTESHFSDCVQAQDTVARKSAINSDECTKLAGLQGVPDKDVVFTFQNGKISRVNSANVGSVEYDKMDGFYGAIIQWAVDNDKTAELDKTGPAGSRFTILSREAGEITVKLCQDYAATKK